MNCPGVLVERKTAMGNKLNETVTSTSGSPAGMVLLAGVVLYTMNIQRIEKFWYRICP